MTPTPDLMRTTFLTNGIEEGHRQLLAQGYTISREKCRIFRAGLRREGAVRDKREMWPEERVAKVREMAAKGYNAASIAHALETTKFAIHGVCTSRGISLRKGATIQIPPRDEVNAVFQGRSLVAGAKIMGVADTTFTRWVRFYGLTRPTPEPKPEVAKSPTPPRSRSFRIADTPPPESGPAAEAARYLRRQGYANVYRRSQEEWWVGRGPMAERDMIARAAEIEARKGRMQA